LPFAFSCSASLLAIGIAIVAAGGCAALEDASADDQAVRPGERTILGRAVPYAADPTLDQESARLASSQKLRREVAWRSLAKILASTSIAEPTVTVPTGGSPDAGERPKLPTFRTWYQKDDIERMFGRIYAAHGPDARRGRKPFAAEKLGEVFDWNATDRGAWTLEEYFARVKEIDTTVEAQGLGGNARVSYSTGLTRHLMQNWAKLSRCFRGEVADEPNAEPASATNFATCLDAEFPADAAAIKASWARSDFNFTVPVHATTPENLTARLAGKLDEGGWGPGAAKASPGEREIYTVRMSDGATFRMPALHLVTKELRHWLWITIWWSPDPDTDFGADRPPAIRDLGGPWKNYKMCVVTDYREGDPDPTGGFPTGPGSLGDALAAVHSGPGGASWCSNPYIERGPKNAQTNCIGCHQHGGTALFSEDILADPKAFPLSGRTLLRRNFPADYLFAATAAPENIASIIDAQVSHFDSVDALSESPRDAGAPVP
jgi:hypothetical protein